MTPPAIRDLRRRLGLSQAAFAVVLGLEGRWARQDIYRFERGEREPTVPQQRVLAALADAADERPWNWRDALLG